MSRFASFVSASEEGIHKGLGILPGRVKKFDLDTNYKIPHMGWNSVSWDDSSMFELMDGIEIGDQFYFVHSYHVCDTETLANALNFIRI